MAPSAAIIEQESANMMMDHRPTEVSTSAVKLPRRNDEILDVGIKRNNNASVTAASSTAKRSYPAVDMNFYAHELVPVGLGAAAVFATTAAVVIVEDDEENEEERASKRVKGCNNNGSPLSCPKLWRPVEFSSGAPGMAVMTSLSHFQHAPKQQQPQQPRVPCSDYSSEDSDEASDENDEE